MDVLYWTYARFVRKTPTRANALFPLPIARCSVRWADDLLRPAAPFLLLPSLFSSVLQMSGLNFFAHITSLQIIQQHVDAIQSLEVRGGGAS